VLAGVLVRRYGKNLLATGTHSAIILTGCNRAENGETIERFAGVLDGVLDGL
jgi:hypothetical protein